MSRQNRRSSRPIRIRPRERYSPAPKSRDEYPVRVKSHDGYVECAPSLLAEISGEALPKPRAPLHLKLEIGGGFLGKDRAVNCGLPSGMEADEITGVLIGRREGPRLLIAAFRRMGAQPVLQGEIDRTENWERAFGGLLARVRWDPKLSGMQPVGWFRASSQATRNLSRRDLAIFNRFFPEYWQIGLVLKAEPGKIGARFFQRQLDRSIDIQNGFQDVVVRRDPEVMRPTTSLPVDPSVYTSAGLRPKVKRSYFWPVVALLAAGVVGSWMLWRSQPAPTAVRQNPTPAVDIGNQASQQAEALWKQWQAEARGRAESLPQPPKSSEVAEPHAVEPHAVEPHAVESQAVETRAIETRVAKNDTRERSDPMPTIQAERRRWPTNVEERLAAIRNQIRSSPRAQQGAPPLERNAVTAPAPQRSLTPPAPSVTPGPSGADSSRQSSTPLTPVDEVPQPPVLTPAPERDPRSPTQAGGPPAGLPTLPTPPVRPNVQSTGVSATAPVLPRSGRLIWTGRLRKNDYLVFDSGKASTGSATGALPGKPVELTVSPGDLTKNGLVVYTARLPKPGGTQESPGPQNGWNKTVYEWDPARTTDFEIVEEPNASNGWKRLVLRARNPKHSIVMVEWKTQP